MQCFHAMPTQIPTCLWPVTSWLEGATSATWSSYSDMGFECCAGLSFFWMLDLDPVFFSFPHVPALPTISFLSLPLFISCLHPAQWLICGDGLTMRAHLRSCGVILCYLDVVGHENCAAINCRGYLPYKLGNNEISEIASFYKISPIFWTFCF